MACVMLSGSRAMGGDSSGILEFLGRSFVRLGFAVLGLGWTFAAKHPEVLTVTADLYSLCSTCWESILGISGEPPYYGANSCSEEHDFAPCGPIWDALSSDARSLVTSLPLGSLGPY